MPHSVDENPVAQRRRFSAIFEKPEGGGATTLTLARPRHFAVFPGPGGGLRDHLAFLN